MTTARKRGGTATPPLTPRKDGFHAVVEKITPEAAQLVLDTRNEHNRTINRHHVETISDEIKNDDYAGLNGQTISFDWNGNLHDGQQRLAAIARSGIPIEALVVYGVDPDTRPTVDVGRKRTVANELEMRGEDNAKTIASILMMKRKIEGPGTGKNVVLTSVEAIKMLDATPDVRAAAAQTVQIQREIDMPASVIGYCKLRFREVSIESDTTFWDVFSTGLYDGQNDPRWVLSRTLTRLAKDQTFSTGAFQNKVYQAALTIKAWNAFREDRGVTILRYVAGKENFPEPV